jgi:tetratricopeptide (TPR) repeat protein
VFQVQADIAGRVTKSLNLALEAGGAPAAARPTTSTDAYDFYLQGNEYYGRQAMADVRLAVQLYRRAVGLDSSFALAWARLARAEAFVYWFGDRSAGQLTRVEQAARRALALAPDLAEAHLAMGYYQYWGLREYAAALDEFAAAAKREPNNAEVAYVSGLVLRRQAKWDQALESFRHAVELDPRSVENLFELASVRFFTRDYAEAERTVDRATALAPDSPNLYALRMMLYLNWEGSLEKPRRLMREALGRFDFARFGSTQTFGDCFDLLAADDAYQAEVARLTPAAFSGVPLFYLFFKASVYHRRGETTRWRAYADSARNEALATIRRHEDSYFTYTTLAVVNAYLGRADEAVEAGKQALEQLPPSKDAMFGPEAYITLAQVYMVLGKPDAAVEQLRDALAIPSYLSAARLRADPLWAPLKGNAAFEHLVGER